MKNIKNVELEDWWVNYVFVPTYDSIGDKSGYKGSLRGCEGNIFIEFVENGKEKSMITDFTLECSGKKEGYSHIFKWQFIDHDNEENLNEDEKKIIAEMLEEKYGIKFFIEKMIDLCREGLHEEYLKR